MEGHGVHPGRRASAAQILAHHFDDELDKASSENPAHGARVTDDEDRVEQVQIPKLDRMWWGDESGASNTHIGSRQEKRGLQNQVQAFSKIKMIISESTSRLDGNNSARHPTH